MEREMDSNPKKLNKDHKTDPLRSDLKDGTFKASGVERVPKSKFREVLDRLKYWVLYRV